MKIENTIPDDWNTYSLGEIADIKMGQSPPSSSYNDSGDGLLLVQGNADIKNRFTKPRFYTNKPTKISKPNSLIMTVRAPVGLISKNQLDICIGRGVCSITSKRVNQEYLYHSLISYENSWHSIQQGSTFTAVNSNDVKNISIHLPPLPEQQKIADILRTVDEKIVVIDHQIKATIDLKKGLMQRLLTKGIGHTEFKDSPLGKIPMSWEVKKLEDIAEVKGGKRLPKGNSLTEEKNSHPYIRVADMNMGGVDITNLLYVPDEVFPSISRYIINKNDLFITVAGTLGLVGQIPKELDGANLTENADKITNIKINKDYLLYVLLSPLIQNAVEKEKTNNAQPKLALTRIRTFKVTVPSLVEQKEIAKILSKVDAKLQTQHNKKQAYQQLKKGLMQQLLTGKIRVENLIET